MKMSDSESNKYSKILSTSEEILWKLTNEEIFFQLRDMFKQNEQKEKKTTNFEDIGIDKETFLEIITTLLSQETLSETQIIELFNKIDVHDSQRITWDNFLDFNLKALQPQIENLFQLGEITFQQTTGLKRDAIIKIVPLETNAYFSYALLTKYGKIYLLDAKLQHLTAYQAIMSREDQFRSAKEARKRNRWLTDAVFIEDINMFVVVNSTGSMTIYDASGLKHVALWHLSGFPNAIQVLTYFESKTKEGRKSLLIGMDNGEVGILHFLKAKDDLLPKKYQDKMSLYYFVEFPELNEYIQFKSLGKFHDRPIGDIKILEDQKTIITCSRDRARSLIILNLENSKIKYKISTERGINCFVANTNKKVFITGSDDGIVRLWPLHKTISTQNSPKSKTKLTKLRKPARLKPLDILRVGNTGIVDVIIMEMLEIFICLTRCAELKIFDLKQCKNLQNIKLNFQCFDISTIRTPEWGTKCIFPGPKRVGMSSNEAKKWERNCLLVTCCNAYASIDLFYLDGQERHLHGEFLPAQPLQNSVLIPQDWESSRGSKSFDFNNTECGATENKIFLKLWEDMHSLNLEFMMRKSDVHSKVALLEERKQKMKWPVQQGAPFMALELFDVEEVQLPANLPKVDNKKTKEIVAKTHKLLNDAASQSIIFSELSSSRSSVRSSASSKISSESKTSTQNVQNENSIHSGRVSRFSVNSTIA